MVNKIIIVDFAGTLVKAEMIEKANEFRSSILKRGLPTKYEHANPKELYKANREFVTTLTGLEPEMTIRYRENDLDFMNITGDKYLNQISTNLFQIGMFMVAKEYGKNIFPKGFIESLKRLQSKGYKLAIVSGVRTDIISGMIAISKSDIQFDYIYGQPPILGIGNEDNLKLLKKQGKILYVIGDKLSDLEPAKKLKAKSIFVTWGHASGGEEKFSDYTIKKPEEILNIVK
jgi:phosphoglycolate phosphatase-like HAD superfamily hydrolase